MTTSIRFAAAYIRGRGGRLPRGVDHEALAQMRTHQEGKVLLVARGLRARMRAESPFSNDNDTVAWLSSRFAALSQSADFYARLTDDSLSPGTELEDDMETVADFRRLDAATTRPIKEELVPVFTAPIPELGTLGEVVSFQIGERWNEVLILEDSSQLRAVLDQSKAKKRYKVSDQGLIIVDWPDAASQVEQAINRLAGLGVSLFQCRLLEDELLNRDPQTHEVLASLLRRLSPDQGVARVWMWIYPGKVGVFEISKGERWIEIELARETGNAFLIFRRHRRRFPEGMTEAQAMQRLAHLSQGAAGQHLRPA
ncbi:MAG: hypothetical protein HQ596_07310 [Candidatus Saganbacteria bacterium]|nr:hypothetical protein [Candidatus Saganbacteria bacterium]